MVAAVYALCLLLHCVVPARSFAGYVLNASGKPVVYRLNGLRVLFLVVVPAAVAMDGMVLQAISQGYWACMCCACALGVTLSLGLYLQGAALRSAGSIDTSRRCAVRGTRLDPTTDKACPEFLSRSAAAHFYCGYEWNPTFLNGLVDGKMFLYLAGAVMLALHILAAASLHAQLWQATPGAAGLVSNAMAVYVCCFGWFCVEYLYFEDVHTFTYDLFAERLGFKLVWGCLCFYPHFYCVGVFAIVDVTPVTDISVMT